MNLRAESSAEPARGPSASATERRQTRGILELVTREHDLDRERLRARRSLVTGRGTPATALCRRPLELALSTCPNRRQVRVTPATSALNQNRYSAPALRSRPNETTPTLDQLHFRSRFNVICTYWRKKKLEPIRFLPTRVHCILDYVVGVALILAPNLFGFANVGGPAVFIPRLLGIVLIAYSLLTPLRVGIDQGHQHALSPGRGRSRRDLSGAIAIPVRVL